MLTIVIGGVLMAIWKKGICNYVLYECHTIEPIIWIQSDSDISRPVIKSFLLCTVTLSAITLSIRNHTEKFCSWRITELFGNWRFKENSVHFQWFFSKKKLKRLQHNYRTVQWSFYLNVSNIFGGKYKTVRYFLKDPSGKLTVKWNLKWILIILQRWELRLSVCKNARTVK